MKQIPEIFSKYPTQLCYIFIVPAMFLLIMIVYRPFGNPHNLNMERNLFFFNATMMMCIILVFLSITRHIYYLLRKHLCKHWWQIIVWNCAEMAVVTFFIALYLTLMDGNVSYFLQLAISLQYTFLILIVPYFVITAVLTIISLKNPKFLEQDTIRFNDSNGQVKIVLLRNAILYIKADENYININYIDGDKVKSYSLRSSMTAISPIMERFGIVRCHRSYYINPQHIVALRRDSGELYQAELDVQSLTIPVTKKWYPDLSKRL